MAFSDAVLLRLLGGESAAALFDDEACRNLAAAAFDVDSLALGDQVQLLIEHIEPGLALSLPVSGSLNFRTAPGMPPGEATLLLNGPGEAVIVDAVVQGVLVAEALVQQGRITRLHGDLLVAAGEAAGTLALTLTPEGPALPQTTRLPVTFAALLFDTADLVAACARTRRVRDALAGRSSVMPGQRETMPVVWLMPAETLDSADWPGAEAAADATLKRLQRRRRAALWQAPLGVALAPVQLP